MVSVAESCAGSASCVVDGSWSCVNESCTGSCIVAGLWSGVGCGDSVGCCVSVDCGKFKEHEFLSVEIGEARNRKASPERRIVNGF